MKKHVSVYRKEVVLTIVGVLCCLCFLCTCIGHKSPGGEVTPGSKYDEFKGPIYDETRLDQIDMGTLLQFWEGRYGYDKEVFLHKAGWQYVVSDGNYGFRYYESPGKYVLGWQYLERDGYYDWYYFDEESGMMVNNTILDGVVLDKAGYAVAITAETAETIRMIHESDHCNEVLLTGVISVDQTIVLSKDVTLVSQKDQTAYVCSSDRKKTSVVQVGKENELTVAEGVCIDACGTARNSLQVMAGAVLHYYGDIDNSGDCEAKYAIAAFGADTTVNIYDCGTISGAETGIYSEGTTNLKEAGIKESEGRWPFGMVVHAATVSSGKMISGNTNHGIIQNGGTLNMSGGNIFNNGTLGSASKYGSLGGGVYLKNKAVMNMSGGTISGNRGSYGAGVYVSSGCRLNMTGGTIGGTKSYDSKATNTTANGNYAREHKMSAGGRKYARGSGGGIYSEGTVNINGKDTVNISYNTCKGPGGGGGILMYAGKLYITGNVNVNYNKAWHSDGTTSADVTTGDPNAEGAGIRVGYDTVKDGALCLINCQDSKGYPVTSGTVTVNNNQASGDGGGIYVSNGTNISLIVKGKTYVQNNTSQNSGGGGIKTLGGAMWIYDAVVSNNFAKAGKGGGILAAGATYLSGCKIYNNKAEQEGGGTCFYTSTVGTTGEGNLINSYIYGNTSGYGGAGVEVRNEATAILKGATKVYGNSESCCGIRCDQKAHLTLEDCYVYGNGVYGVYNLGTAIVSGNTKIGYSDYQSDVDYVASANATGGIYNTGVFTVKTGKKLFLFGGSGCGINNQGNTLFENGSKSILLGLHASNMIQNTGTLTAVGTDGMKGPVILLAGEGVACGLDNNGGTVMWSGQIHSTSDVGYKGFSLDQVTGMIDVGVRNRGKGQITTYTVSRIEGCKKAVYNGVNADAYISGSLDRNTGCGIDNDGNLYLGSVGNTVISMNNIVGVNNKGTLYGDHHGSYFCLITGTGTGIKNTGTCYLGKNMKVASETMEERTGILNRKGGQLYITGGEYRNSSAGGVYCKNGSQFYMGRDAMIDAGNFVFLESDCVIELNEPLTSLGVAAVITTEEGMDRMPGRVMVRASYAGGTGRHGLYTDDGNQRFLLAYDKVDTGEPAFLFDGSRIRTIETVNITDRDIYLSTCYPITFDSGISQISGATVSDVRMMQIPMTKYWMEDVVLNLEAPVLTSKKLIDRGWKYSHWECDSGVTYIETRKLFTDNRRLHLTALWNQNKTNMLDAWLYDRSAWLRNQMVGSKEDENYKYFMGGDIGVITFSSVNLTDVSITWPNTGSVNELKTYDDTGTNLKNRTFQIDTLTDDISQVYKNSAYQFKVPMKTPAGIYDVTVSGKDEEGQTITCVLSITVGEKAISSTIRTRIR